MTDSLAHTRTTLPKYAQDVDRPYVGDPWSRQPNEPAVAYSGFLIYLALENRTFAATDRVYCERNDVKVNQARVGRWAKAHRWEERALAYDNFMSAAQIAANKRALVQSSARHAKQAADAQSIIMLPVEQLRKRIEEQGGELKSVTDLDDVSLMKLFNAFSKDLPTFQKAERDALGSTGDTVVPRAEIRAKGELVRRMLADGTVRELAERVAFEVVAPITTDGSDD